MNAFKIISWLVLVLFWVAVVAGTLIYGAIGGGLGLGVVALVCFGAWGIFLAWANGIRRQMTAHLGISPKDATFQEKTVTVSRLADVRLALERMFAEAREPAAKRYGVSIKASGASILQGGDAPIVPVQWSTTETADGRYDNFPTNAIYLLRHGELPFAAYIHFHTHLEGYVDEFETYGINPRLQVTSRSIAEGTKIINAIIDEAGRSSVYRGKIAHVSRSESGRGHTIRVADRPCIDAERIVLPADVFQVLKRSVAGRLKHHDLLQRHGHGSKTGILLHGPPGTGKTLMLKYLIGNCPGYSAIVPAGLEAATIRESFRLAAYLQPALVIIEDVDLLAERRETNANVTGLQELMNEMDGLMPTAEVIVLMTTNRPEVVEPAVASRPGRVSQAIRFPLPDSALRERLLKLYCGPAVVADVLFPTWVARTEGASPAFLEELAKRAIVIAADRSPAVATNGAIRLSNDDFDRAIHELVVFGEVVTANILGFSGGPRNGN